MYKAAVRFLIRRSVTKLNAGDYGPALGIFTDDAVLCFPGVSSWSTRFRPGGGLRPRQPSSGSRRATARRSWSRWSSPSSPVKPRAAAARPLITR